MSTTPSATRGGDEVLREVAGRIKDELRLSDALARFGGEEFVVLLIDADLDSATQVAQRIRASIAAAPVTLGNGFKVAVSVSIGVTTLADFDRDSAIEQIAQQLLARADAALYRAKENGRNQVISLE
jgi:diguanylate cyclase (GGDEF)-like protein